MSVRSKKNKAVATRRDNFEIPVSPSLSQYYDMVTYCRPAGSKAEREFINKYIRPLPGVVFDGGGNALVKVGQSQVMWSSHTDTVHLVSGRQSLVIDERQYLYSDVMRDEAGNKTNIKASCLGADCTTGVYLMIQMINAGVPGLYVFHRAEERGGIGSSYIKGKLKSETYEQQGLFKGINYAIAFDRKGISSIITEQTGSVCCSKEFTDSFAAILNTPFEYSSNGKTYTIAMGYKGDNTGTFTDTANYISLINECTNLSVGYYSQHTSSECQDLRHMEQLRVKLLSFDESKLVHKRDASAYVEPVWGKYGRRYGSYGGWADDYASYGSHGGWADDYQDQYDYMGGALNRWNYGTGKVAKARTEEDKVEWLYHLVQDHPSIITEILEEFGFDYDTLRNEIISRGGFVEG